MTCYVAVLLPERVGWSVLFPDLPGCTTQGDSIQEAIRMAGDALAGYVASLVDHNERLPAPRGLDEIKGDKAWAKEAEVDWSKVVVASVAT